MLKVEGINQYYGGSHILRNLGVRGAARARSRSCSGRNGVGKTTLLKSLMGVVPVKTGTHPARRRAHHATTRPTSACARAWATCRRAARSSAA